MESAGRFNHRKPPDRLHKHSLAKWAQWEILPNGLKVGGGVRASVIPMSGLQWVRGVDFYEAQCGGGTLCGQQPQVAALFELSLLCQNGIITPEQRRSVEVSGALWFSPVYLCQCVSASCFRSAAPVKNAEADNAKTARVMWSGVIYGWKKKQKKRWLGL